MIDGQYDGTLDLTSLLFSDCGTLTDVPPIASLGNSLSVVMVTDDEGSEKGFRATYEAGEIVFTLCKFNRFKYKALNVHS